MGRNRRRLSSQRDLSESILEIWPFPYAKLTVANMPRRQKSQPGPVGTVRDLPVLAAYVGCAMGRAVAGSAALWCLRLDHPPSGHSIGWPAGTSPAAGKEPPEPVDPAHPAKAGREELRPMLCRNFVTYGINCGYGSLRQEIARAANRCGGSHRNVDRGNGCGECFSRDRASGQRARLRQH
jgi:hypothetical protein